MDEKILEIRHLSKAFGKNVVLRDIDFSVKQGDVIGVKSTKKDIAIFKAAKEGSGRVVPKWLTTDLENLTATVAALPQRDDVDLTLQENMIVEFYSR